MRREKQTRLNCAVEIPHRVASFPVRLQPRSRIAPMPMPRVAVLLLLALRQLAHAAYFGLSNLDLVPHRVQVLRSGRWLRHLHSYSVEKQAGLSCLVDSTVELRPCPVSDESICFSVPSEVQVFLSKEKHRTCVQFWKHHLFLLHYCCCSTRCQLAKLAPELGVVCVLYSKPGARQNGLAHLSAFRSRGNHQNSGTIFKLYFCKNAVNLHEHPGFWSRVFEYQSCSSLLVRKPFIVRCSL